MEPGADFDELRVWTAFALELPWLGSGNLTVETVVDRTQWPAPPETWPRT